jgi:hypothetical protein
MSDKPLHWSKKRSKPIDRSKRVAYGCTISTDNIISSGTRRRTDFDYSQTNLGRNGKLTIQRRKTPRRSTNILEKREKEVKTDKKRKSVTSDEEKPPKKQKEEKSESKEATPSKSQKNDSDKKQTSTCPLAPAVVAGLEKIGVKVPKVSKEPRKYRGQYVLPDAFDVFGKISWPKNTLYMNKALDLYGLEFVETDIAEAKEYPFLAKNADYYFVAEGEHMLVSLLHPKEKNFDHSDFNVYVVKENVDKPDGPHKLSTILKGLEIDTETIEVDK